MVGPVEELKILSPENMYTPPEETKSVTLSGNIDQKDSVLDYSVDKDGYTFFMNFYDRLGNSFMGKINVMRSETDDSVYSVKVGDILDANGKSILVNETVDANGNTVYSSSGQYLNFGGVDLTGVFHSIHFEYFQYP